MKKLMMAAAIALVAVGVQAASVDWVFTEQVKTANTYADLSSASAYLFLASDWATVAGKATGTQLKVEDFSGFLDSQALTKTTAATANTFGMNQKTFTDAKVAGSKSYNIVVVDSLADGGKVWVSEALTVDSWDETVKPEPTHTLAKWAVAKANTAKYLTGDSNAYTFGSGGDTPEPTSAMLLLLGVAGLALRRKTK